MPVTSVSEKLIGTRSGTIDRMWQRTYTRTFVVETSGPQVGPIQVRGAVGIPQLGNVYTNGLVYTDPDYESDLGAFVQSIEATMDSGHENAGLQWTVTVNYGPYDTSEFGGDPTSWKIKVSFGGDQTERVVYFDAYGNPITNSAGDPFDPPLTIEGGRSTMTVTRNELVSAFDLTLAEAYRDKINDATWNGFAARTVKLGIITTSEPQYDSYNQVYYYTVTYPFTIDRRTWRSRLLDQGCNELTGYGYGVKTRPIMTQGQQVSDPVPLNGAGQRLPVGGTPVTIDVDGYDEADFSGLNIDLSLRLGA